MGRHFSNYDYLIGILAGTATIIATAIAQPAIAAKTAQEVAQIAQDTTVQINNLAGDPGGTGAIIAKQGNTYTVLTANHVVMRADAPYTIRTANDKEYPVSKVQRLQSSQDGPDLALVTFNSSDNYPVATLGDSDQASIGADIYVCGYPLPSLGAGKEREFLFTKGIVSSRPKNRPKGYTLRYDAITRVGMSGGPVFDILGRLVGVHGQADIDDSVGGDSGQTVAIKTGINAGIPINIFVAMKPQTGINVAIDNATTSDNPTARLSNPQTAKDYYARGISRFDEDDFQGAVENYNQALRLAPNFSDAYSRRGAAKLRLIGDSDLQLSLSKNRGALLEAVQDLNQALRLNPNDSFAYNYRGYAHYFLKENQKAMEDATQALRIDPSDPEVYNLRGLLRDDLDDYEGAIKDYTQAIALNPNDFWAYGNRSLTYLNKGDNQKAIEDANQAVKIKPNHTAVYLIRGVIRFKQGNEQEAIADINQSLKIDPNNYASYWIRSLINFKQGNNQVAMEDINQSLKINSDFAEAYYFRATFRFGQGDNQGGSADLNQAIKINPNYADAYYLRGNFRYSQNNAKEALEDYNQALSINPNYAEAYANRAAIRYEQKDEQGAISDLNQAIKINPNYAEAYFVRGAIRAKQGDKQGAIADFQKAAELYQQQGNQENYQKVQQLLRQLQQ